MIAIILAEVYSFFVLAKLFKKEIVLLIFIIFLLYFFGIEEESIHPAPFLSALLMNLLPSFFFPLIAKNKLSLLNFLVSIYKPLKFT